MGVVACNSLPEAEAESEAVQLSEFKANLIYTGQQGLHNETLSLFQKEKLSRCITFTIFSLC